MSAFSTVITIIGVIIASFVGLAAFFNAQQKKVLDSGRMLEKVDNIQKTVDEIAKDSKTANENTQTILKNHDILLERHSIQIEANTRGIEEINSVLKMRNMPQGG